LVQISYQREYLMTSLPTSASATPKIMEIEIRRKFMSRIADSVLKTFIWMLAANTFSAELVRLPSFYTIYHPFPWGLYLQSVSVMPLVHHLLKYLVNVDFDAQPTQFIAQIYR
jgi:hypothetical protein